MEHVLFILSSHDIEPALSRAREYAGCRVAVFDPSLLDQVRAGGLENAEYVDFPGCPTFPDLHDGSREMALATERELFEVVREYMPGVSNFSWLHLNFYYLFIASRWYTALGLHIAATYEERFGDAQATVFINDNPSMFFWPSFVPAVALLEAMQSRAIRFEGFTYGERADETGAIPMLVGGKVDQSAQWDLLVHLPTCLHDGDFLKNELAASGKSVLNLRAKYWDMPVPGTLDVGMTQVEGMLGYLSPAASVQLDDISARLSARIDTLLEAHLRTPSYRTRQVAQLVALYRSQFVMHMQLHAFFRTRTVGKMLIADHDANFHGPLLAYAETHDIPVLFVPHSKTTADIQYAASVVTCLTHPIQGDSIVDALGAPVRSHKMIYPERLEGSGAAPRPLRRVGLLLNAISLNGVLVTETGPFIAGVRQVAAWCRARGIELVVRGRPGATMFNMVEEATGVSIADQKACLAGSLVAFAADQDLCIMYDAPTTAEIDFLRNSVPILNAIPEPLAKYEAVLSDTSVVPRGSVAQILARLDSYVDDEAAFHAFRVKQFATYAGSFKDARPLRALLESTLPADSSILSELTVVIPTYNRHDSLARALEFWSTLPVHLIVVDGGSTALDLATLGKRPASLRYFHMPVSMEERIKFAAGLCHTEFSMLACDDEYFLGGGLAAAAQQLRDDPSLSAAGGRCAAFLYNEHGMQIGTFKNCLKEYSETSPLASNRLKRITDCFPIQSGFYYSVNRTTALKGAVDIAFRQRFSCPYVQEMLYSACLFIQGGMVGVKPLMWLRNVQAPMVTNAQWNRALDFVDWYQDPQYAAEVAQMRGHLAEIYERHLAQGETPYPLDDFFAALIGFDLQQRDGTIEGEKFHLFGLDEFLILSRQHGLPVDEPSIRVADRVELEAQVAASPIMQAKARGTVW